MRKKLLVLIFIAALLPLITYLIWHYKTYDPYKGYSSYYDGISIDINGKGQMKTISTITPDGFPEDHYVFLPSSAVLPETRIYYKEADVLILSAEGHEDIALYSGGNLSNVERDLIYQTAFYSKSGEVLDKGKMLFMQSTDTAAVYVETESGGMENIYNDKEYREYGKIYIEDSAGNIEYMGDLKYIKGHGNTTWKEDKKSLGVMLNDPADLFNMGVSYSWVLMANCLDQTMFANSLVYDMARNAGMPYTPELHYADLYLNGKYNGLYQIAEKNEIGAERIDITDLNTKNQQANNALDHGMYEAYSENPKSEGERKGVCLPVDPLDITGGYIIEHDYGEKYSNEVSGFRTATGEKYVLRSPVYASEKEVNYIAEIFEEIEKRAIEGEELSDLIDIESFADKYLVEEIVKNDGAGATSSYFYKDADSVDGHVYAGPVWDYDMALGNSGRGLTDIPDHLDFCTNHMQQTRLFYYLYMNNSEFRETVKKDYQEKFRPLLKELIDGKVDEYREVVDKDDNMDTARWKRGANERYEAVDIVKDFLKKRMEFLDRVWIDDEEIHVVHLLKDRGSRHPYIGVLDGGTMEILPTPKSREEDTEEPFWMVLETGERLDEDTPVHSDMTLISSSYYEEYKGKGEDGK
ncbi:MAG: CotH kinase family protein [Lachnospiraceae bacterium]|nr:CotH kinase family protein [Lachnospiraceae bacterium]